MLWAAALILLANWALGLLSGADLDGWVHLMLGAALVSLAFAALATARGRGAGKRTATSATPASRPGPAVGR